MVDGGHRGDRLVITKTIDNSHTLVADVVRNGEGFDIVTYYNKNKSLQNMQFLSPEGKVDRNPTFFTSETRLGALIIIYHKHQK